MHKCFLMIYISIRILIKSCKYLELDSGIRFCKFATFHLMSIIGKKIYRSIGEQKN